jgi:uncharacterized protein (DUF58 family)
VTAVRSLFLAAVALALPATTLTAATTPRAAATATPPSQRLVDPADTPGRLDLRSVRLAQSAASLKFSFTTARPFALVQLSGTQDRTVCVDLVPRGRPASGQRLCLIGTAAATPSTGSRSNRAA